MWDQITVEQYQQVQRLNKEPLEDLDKMVRIIQILFGLSENQVNDLPVPRFNEMVAKVTETFSSGLKAGIPPKSIRVGRRRYRMLYAAKKLTYGQWTDLQHFLNGDTIENLHYVAAVIATRKRLFKAKPNFQAVANDFLNANFLKTYNAVVFFCLTMTGLKKVTRDFLESPKKVTTQMKTILNLEAEKDLSNGMDGSIQPPS
jgi:hypothetical protein